MKPITLFLDWHWLSRPFRVVLLVMAGLVLTIAILAWRMPVLRDFERSFYDVRAAIGMARVDHEDRIVQIVYTDETLAATGRRSPLDRSFLARALRTIDTMQPRGVAVDILIDQAQPEDFQLIAALKAMKTPVRLASVARDAAGDGAIDSQIEFLDKFRKQVASDTVKFGNIVIDVDDDNVVRFWPSTTGEPNLVEFEGMPKFPGAPYVGPINFRAPRFRDRPVFTSIPIDVLVDANLMRDQDVRGALAEQIRGRYVIIGGAIADVDLFETPMSAMTSRPIWGVDVWSHILAQRLDGIRLGNFSLWLGAIIAVAAFAGGWFSGSRIAHRWQRVIAMCAGLTFWMALGLLIDRLLGQSFGMNQVGWLVAWLAGFCLAAIIRHTAAIEKGRSATLALFRYLPPEIAQSIVSDPERLALKGQRTTVFALFTDLEGFTKLCHAVDPGTMAEFLNEYLESISQVILNHGGTIDKFVGDAVVAFWGAPLSLDDDGRRAVEAALAIQQVTDRYRGRALGAGQIVGRTRIGVHYGPAIIGNFGGEGRLQYTALGDTMNVAARLEAANKELGTSILISLEVYERINGVSCRRMGRVEVRGRSTPLDIFEPIAGPSSEDVDAFNAVYTATLSGDQSALEALRNLAESDPGDSALAGLVARLSRGEVHEATRIS